MAGIVTPGALDWQAIGSLNPDFTDETVVVTGAAPGAGREAALRFGDAGGFLYLASEDASYVTGELVTIDGGWSVF